MSTLTANQIANSMLAHLGSTDAGAMAIGSADVTSQMKAAIVDCLMAAQEEMRDVCAAAFTKRVGVVFTGVHLSLIHI